MDIEKAILFENKDFLVLHKPAGMLTQSSKEGEESLESMITQYHRNKLHFMSRIDRPVSGCLISLKHRKWFNKLQIPEVSKEYIAVVEKKEMPKQQTLTHYLLHDQKNRKAHCSEKEKEHYKKAILHYTLIEELDKYNVLQIKLDTGRFHQIRAQLAHEGYHIKGDVKYGARRKNKDRSIHLHAWKVVLPLQNEPKTIVAPFPESDGLWKALNAKING